MPPGPNLIRIVRIGESRNLPLQLLGRASRSARSKMSYPIPRSCLAFSARMRLFCSAVNTSDIRISYKDAE